MASFCTKCGAPLSGGSFCAKCGADMRNIATPAQQQIQTPAAGSPVQSAPAAAPPTAVSPKKMSPLAKLGIAAVVIIFVGGALAIGGVYYVAHRVSQKIHEKTHELLGSSSGSDDSSSGNPNSDNSGSGNSSADSSDNSMGDVCRFLSKEDVSKAIGVEIIRTESKDNGCSYIAKGTQADVMAKHATAMAASRGADKKTQQVLQQFAGGMFNAFQSERPQSEQDKSGEVPVFNFSVDQHGAEERIRMTAKGLSVLGDTQGLPGIGDQAFVSSDGMIMVRKGDKLVTIMYLTCPCGTEAVTPLAKEIADAL